MQTDRKKEKKRFESDKRIKLNWRIGLSCSNPAQSDLHKPYNHKHHSGDSKTPG